MSLESSSTTSPIESASSVAKQKSSWLCKLWFVLCVLLLVYSAYNLLYKQDKQAQRIDAALALVQQSRQELQHLQAEFDAVRAQAVIEESMRKALELSLADAQSDLLRAQEQLAFYDQLMPAGPNGALSVRALDISRSDDQLHYRVLLQRNAQQAEPFSGRLEFEANGQQVGHTGQTSLVLQPVAGREEGVEQSPNILGLNFDRFQRSDGWLQIPAGFEPQSVTLKVFEGNVLRVTRKIELEATLKP